MIAHGVSGVAFDYVLDSGIFQLTSSTKDCGQDDNSAIIIFTPPIGNIMKLINILLLSSIIASSCKAEGDKHSCACEAE